MSGVRWMAGDPGTGRTANSEYPVAPPPDGRTLTQHTLFDKGGTMRGGNLRTYETGINAP